MSIQKALGVYIGLALLYLMVVFPMTLHLLYIKAALFGLLCSLTLFSWVMRGRIGLHHDVLIWAIFVAAIGVIFSFIGVLQSTPGANKQLQVYAFWPLVYVAVLAGANGEHVLGKIHRTLVVATVSIAIYGLILLLTRLGQLPDLAIVEWLSFEEEQAGGLEDGFFAIRYQGLNSLPFLVPYIFASLCLDPTGNQNAHVNKLLLWCALILSLLVVVISGRRGLQLVVALTPLYILAIAASRDHRRRKETGMRLMQILFACAIAVFFSFLYLGSNYDVSFGDLVAAFKTGFDFSAPATESAYVRREQWYALISGWEEHPLLGNGHGASATGSIRDQQLPWAYELYYVALLFQVGLLGLLAYISAIAWIYWKGVSVIRNGGTLGSLMFTSLAGMTGILIASATNPYLARFDGWWTIFLPLAIINCWLLRRTVGPISRTSGLPV